MSPYSGEMQTTADLHNLVEAATTAAAQEHFRKTSERTQIVEDPFTTHRCSRSEHGTKRKRSGQVAHSDNRGKGSNPNEARDAPEGLGDQDPSSRTHFMDDQHKGHHTASAIFRKPGKAKKQTRPAISSMYASLQLSPENFLTLQSAAKVYMLDPEYPERQDCIGVRGKSDGKGVRLELARYAREFLADGVGERFFGADSDPPGDPGNDFEQVVGPLDDMDNQRHDEDHDEPEQSNADPQQPKQEVENALLGQQLRKRPGKRSFDKRDFVWPQDKDKIIKLCMPLLRRIVSNEKQRQYALASRRAGRDPQHEHTATELGNRPRVEAGFANGSATIRSSDTTASLDIFFVDSEDITTVRRRRTMVLEDSVSTVWELVQHAIGHDIANEVRIQTSDGLIRVTDERTCRDNITEALRVPWFENIARVIVLIEEDKSEIASHSASASLFG